MPATVNPSSTPATSTQRITEIQPDSNGLFHPIVEEDIIELIQFAIANNRQVRVRGAAQSVPGAVYTDGFGTSAAPANANINIMLDQMRKVTITPDSTLVTVQGGCNLGFDPFDPTGASNESNGLFSILLANGLAIPNVSDAIHQTVAGYISTASSGGTVSHSFLDAIMSIRMIDGTGKVHVFNRPNPDNPGDPFYAAGVSLGLLGVITEVTLQCIPSFNVIGQQAITPDTEAAFDFFGPGSASKPSLQNFLQSTEFTRMIWWPYPTVKRLITWQARTMQPGDYNQQTGSPSDFHPNPYKDAFSSSNLPLIKDLPPAISGFVAEAVASGIYSVMGSWPKILYNLFGNEVNIDNKTISTSTIQAAIELAWPALLPHMMNGFIPCDGDNPPDSFWDHWTGLANDTHEYSNNLLPANRAEFWFPLSEAQQVMTLLESYYSGQFFPGSNDSNRNVANGSYVVEILGAKNSPFWLSPSYQQDSLRINFYSLMQNDENVHDYFGQFYDLFFKHKINFRLHWGYYLPLPNSLEGGSYLQGQYPQWSAFDSLRKQMDPQGIFLTSYWKEQLNIG